MIWPNFDDTKVSPCIFSSLLKKGNRWYISRWMYVYKQWGQMNTNGWALTFSTLEDVPYSSWVLGTFLVDKLAGRWCKRGGGREEKVNIRHEKQGRWSFWEKPLSMALPCKQSLDWGNLRYHIHAICKNCMKKMIFICKYQLIKTRFMSFRKVQFYYFYWCYTLTNFSQVRAWAEK